MDSNWRKIEIINGDLKLVCLPAIGGRLWDIVFNGCSLLFQNPDLIDIIPDLAKLDQLPTRSPQFRFPLWGGEKTWVAPDSAWPAEGPHPALDSGPYKVASQDGRHVCMQSETCPHSNLQIERAITLESSTNWRIGHRLSNCGSNTPTVGIWSVMMFSRPALIALKPENAADPFSVVFGDPQDCVQANRGNLMHRCNRGVEFKTGTRNPDGKVLINLGFESDTIALLCSTAKAGPSDMFAHGHDFEVFNSKDYGYCEAEWHSPALALEPGADIRFHQNFEIVSDSGHHRDHGLAVQNGK